MLPSSRFLPGAGWGWGGEGSKHSTRSGRLGQEGEVTRPREECRVEGRWAGTREGKGRFEKQQPFVGQERKAGLGKPGTARTQAWQLEPSVSSVRHYGDSLERYL